MATPDDAAPSAQSYMLTGNTASDHDDVGLTVASIGATSDPERGQLEMFGFVKRSASERRRRHQPSAVGSHTVPKPALLMLPPAVARTTPQPSLARPTMPVSAHVI